MATYALVHGAGDVGWYWHLVERELAVARLIGQLAELRRHIGYVPQHGGLLPHWTVLRNVGLVPGLLSSSYRPQEILSAQVMDAMVKAVNQNLERIKTAD